jgi:hypothetical protein
VPLPEPLAVKNAHAPTAAMAAIPSTTSKVILFRVANLIAKAAFG